MQIRGQAPRPREQAGRLDRASSTDETPSWAERLLLVLVVTLPLATGWAGSLLDSIVTIVDANYRTVTIYEGTWARNVRVLLLLAVLAVAVQVVIAGVRRGRNPVTWFTVAATVAFVVVNLRVPMDGGELASHTVALAALAAAAVSRVDTRSLALLGWLAVLYAASSWIYFLLGAANASVACRPDKCSYLGVLLVGGSSHEQLLGLRLAFLLPAVAFIHVRLRTPAVLLLLATVLASGSRTAMAATLVSLVGYWVLLGASAPGSGLFSIRRGQRALHQALALAPLGGLGLSLVLFLFVPRDALTSRGEIYSVLRSAVLESPLLGPGREALETAYSIGTLSFDTPHEHSQAGYLLATGGLVLFLLFLAGVVRLTQVAQRPGQVAVVLFALAPAAAFVTEPIWTFDIIDMGFGTLAVTTMLLATAEARSRQDGGPWFPWRTPEPLHHARQHQERG